ncbi:hypothetical protein [Nostoc sp. CALU 1950]|uniref:hypothetical protein n=1 Tax=Nostoc sp. CALU 1950 TaxID=3104321 RepID=UPI003EB9379A
MKNTTTFLDSYNNDLFFELSDYEASINSGGILFTNASKQPITFVGLDGNLAKPKSYLLANKGSTTNVTEPYIVYDSDTSKSFIPITSERLDSTQDYTFSVNKNYVSLSSEDA